MKKRIASLIGLLGLTLVGVGCGSGDPAPIQGDNPAAQGAVNATPEQTAARGGVKQTTAPPGTGRAASGTDALPPSGG